MDRGWGGARVSTGEGWGLRLTGGWGGDGGGGDGAKHCRSPGSTLQIM